MAAVGVMRICVVVQSAAFLDSAGARIRYRRFAQDLPPGVTLDVVPIADLLAQKQFAADAYVFAKVFSANALILGHHLRAIGKWVGHDLFDDYFSQDEDSRLGVYRTWMTAMAPCTDFAVCTTPHMLAVATRYLPAARLHIVPDPYEPFDLPRLSALLAAKAARIAETRHIRAVWFGIGDNPFFPVGLQDLATHAGVLARARRLGWTIELKVVTNLRALSADGLALIRALPLPTVIEEWSEAAEGAALEAGDIAFLPVSAQSFSRAKSLNRAITSLCSGCQVLSTGHALYQALEEVVYRSIDPLLDDLAARRGKLRADNTASLMRVLKATSDPVAAAHAFVQAATPERPAPARQAGGAKFCVVHGMDSPSENHKLTVRLKGLSVRSPFHNGRLNYHVRFDAKDGGYDVFVERSLIDQVDPGLTFDRTHLTRIVDSDYARIDGETLGLGAGHAPHCVRADQLVAKVAAYPHVIAAVTAACRRMFPELRVVVSESSHFALPPRRIAAAA